MILNQGGKCNEHLALRPLDFINERCIFLSHAACGSTRGRAAHDSRQSTLIRTSRTCVAFHAHNVGRTTVAAAVWTPPPLHDCPRTGGRPLPRRNVSRDRTDPAPRRIHDGGNDRTSGRAMKHRTTSLPSSHPEHRRIAFTLVMLSVPVLFFLFSEAILRATGFGPNLSLFVTETVNGQPYLVMNPAFASRYFARVPFHPQTAPDYFLEPKPPGTFRIFCLGGSTSHPSSRRNQSR